MLFPAQGNLDRTNLDRLRRTANRLREEGVPPLQAKTQIKIIAAGLGASGYAIGRTIESIVKSAYSGTSDTTGNTISPVKPMAKRLRTGDDSEVAEVESAAKSQQMIAGSNGGIKALTQETPITLHAPEYGLPETYTVLQPMNLWFTAAVLDKLTPVECVVRLNSPIDVLASTLATPVGAATITKGLYNQAAQNLTIWPGTPDYYPNGESGVVPTGVETPAWRQYFEQLYDVYSVLGVQWKLVCQNVSTTLHNNVLLGVGYNSYGASDTSGMFPSTPKQRDILRWNDVQFHIAKSQHTDEETLVVTGTYRPGQNKRNVTNDADVTTWSKSGVHPTFREELMFYFYRHGMAKGTNILHINCHLELKYIVQYKDLKQQIRYPTAGGAAIPQSLPNGALETW